MSAGSLPLLYLKTRKGLIALETRRDLHLVFGVPLVPEDCGTTAAAVASESACVTKSDRRFPSAAARTSYSTPEYPGHIANNNNAPTTSTPFIPCSPNSPSPQPVHLPGCSQKNSPLPLPRGQDCNWYLSENPSTNSSYRRRTYLFDNTH
jgi:hypothetical protein